MKQGIICFLTINALVMFSAFNTSQQEEYTEQAGGTDILMVAITGGEFYMGSIMDEPGRYTDEHLHKVKVSNFYIGKYEITRKQYKAIAGTDPSVYAACGDDCPVCKVNWKDAVIFCNSLSKQAGLKEYYIIGDTEVSFDASANGYRLPTEAEWEYAARAGTETTLYTGTVTAQSKYNWPELDAVAYYGGNSCADYEEALDCSDKEDKQIACDFCGPQPVGKKQPNAFGLYDMLGNVWEWCFDYYGPYFAYQEGKEVTISSVEATSDEVVENPQGPGLGKMRVRRGGSWKHSARNARCANRSNRMPTYKGEALGFRIARNAP